MSAKKIFKMIGLLVAVATIPLMLRAVDIIWNPQNLGNANDLTVPTAARQYPLGTEIVVWDTTETKIKTYEYIQADEALSQYGIYQIDRGSETLAITPKLNNIGQIYVVTPAAFTKDYYGFVQTSGDCVVLTTSTASEFEYGEISPLIPQCTSQVAATAISSCTVGQFQDTFTRASTTANFFLYGWRAHSLTQ